MKKLLISATVTASLLTLALISAPHNASADTNGICLLDPPDLISNGSNAGYPVFPSCTVDRKMRVLSAPDPSAAPMSVNVMSLPSSAPLNGSVTVTNFPTPVAVQPVVASTTVPIAGSVSVSNFPASLPYPTPPANQAVTVTNTPSVTVNNFPTPVPVQAVSIASPIAVSNFPTPIPIQPVSAATNLPVVQPAAKYTIFSSAGTTALSGAKVFLGTANISTSAQITAITCYDNASAASGPIVLSTVLGLTPPWFPSGGISLANGLTCNVPASLLGNGVAVYWRTF